MNRLVAALAAVLVAALAAPALAETVEASPPEEPAPLKIDEPAPAASASRDPVHACKLQRSSQMLEAQASSDRATREAILLGLPDCEKLAASLAAPPPPAGPPVKEGATSEVGVGYGTLMASGASLNGLAVSLGAGGFLSDKVSLSARIAGTLAQENATFFIGYVGPSVQVWLAPQLFVGGGFGLGVLAGCGGTCDAEKTSAYDLRIGMAFDRTGHGANISVEMSSIGDFGLRSLGIMIGHQGF